MAFLASSAVDRPRTSKSSALESELGVGCESSSDESESLPSSSSLLLLSAAGLRGFRRGCGFGFGLASEISDSASSDWGFGGARARPMVRL